jgi:hypothetical protein
MSDTHYLCRTPVTGGLIILSERDYKYQRHHEARLYVLDPKGELVLLAQGSKKEMWLFKELSEETNKC